MRAALSKGTFGLLLPALVAMSIGAAWAGDLMAERNWDIVETVEVQSHSPHNAVRLYEAGRVDALGLRAVGGAIRCFRIEIWLTDGRRAIAENRTLEEDQVVEFEFDGTNRRVNRIEFSCHPKMGVTQLNLEILVR